MNGVQYIPGPVDQSAFGTQNDLRWERFPTATEEESAVHLVPTLRRGNAVGDAQASRTLPGRWNHSHAGAWEREEKMLQTFASFVNECQKLAGQTLYTSARGNPFVIEVERGDVYFLPRATGKRRLANKEKTERVLALLAQSGDWSPSRYRSITFHASYILAVAKSAQP